MNRTAKAGQSNFIDYLNLNKHQTDGDILVSPSNMNFNLVKSDPPKPTSSGQFTLMKPELQIPFNPVIVNYKKKANTKPPHSKNHSKESLLTNSLTVSKVDQPQITTFPKPTKKITFTEKNQRKTEEDVNTSCELNTKF